MELAERELDLVRAGAFSLCGADPTAARLDYLRALEELTQSSLAGAAVPSDHPALLRLDGVEVGDPLDVRAFVAVVDAEEALAEPALVREFAAAFGPAAEATLILCAAGWDDDRIATELGEMLDREGLDGADAPDLLAVPQAVAQVADRAHVVLTRRPADGSLPHVVDAGQLREHERRSRVVPIAA